MRNHLSTGRSPQCSQALLISAVVGLFCCATVHAQYPDHPIRIVVPFPPGNAPDLQARLGILAVHGEEIGAAGAQQPAQVTRLDPAHTVAGRSEAAEQMMRALADAAPWVGRVNEKDQGARAPRTCSDGLQHSPARPPLQANAPAPL